MAAVAGSLQSNGGIYPRSIYYVRILSFVLPISAPPPITSSTRRNVPLVSDGGGSFSVDQITVL